MLIEKTFAQMPTKSSNRVQIHHHSTANSFAENTLKTTKMKECVYKRKGSEFTVIKTCQCAIKTLALNFKAYSSLSLGCDEQIVWR